MCIYRKHYFFILILVVSNKLYVFFTYREPFCKNWKSCLVCTWKRSFLLLSRFITTPFAEKTTKKFRRWVRGEGTIEDTSKSTERPFSTKSISVTLFCFSHYKFSTFFAVICVDFSLKTRVIQWVFGANKPHPITIQHIM